MSKIVCLGSGGWGIALALNAFQNGHDVTLWSPFENEVEMLTEKRTNPKLLSGVFILGSINSFSSAVSSLTWFTTIWFPFL